MGLLALCLAAFLACAEKPWETQVAKLIAQGDKVPLDAFVADGLWWAVLACLIVVVTLLGTMPWWLLPMPEPEQTEKSRSSQGAKMVGLHDTMLSVPHRFFLLLLLAVCVLALIERWPRLGLSLWNDEEYTLRRYVLGHQKPLNDGSLTLDRVSWRETFFLNRGANNHIPFSVAARLSLEAWRAMGGGRDDGRIFSEAALRLPALAAGLAGIYVVGLLMMRVGSPVAGLGTAAMLALHPWHVRYSVEARGYAFLLLFAALAMWFAVGAMERGHWRNWMGYALCQFFALWSFPGAVHLAAVSNMVLLAGVLVQRPRWSRGLAQGARWTIANATSACLFLLAMGPSLRQIKLYLARDIAQGEMGADWWRDMGAHFAAGVRFAMDDPANAQYLSLQHLPGAGGAGSLIALGFVLVLVALGVVVAIRLGLPVVLVTLAPCLGALLAYCHTKLSGNFLFSWYLLYALPGLAALPFLGIEGIARLLPAGRRRQALAAAALSLLALVAYGSWTSSVRLILKTVPRQPLREAAAAAKDAAPNAIIAATGVSSRQFISYCPALQPVDEEDSAKNLALLDQLLERARADHRPLVVLFSGGSLRKAQDAALHSRLSQPDLFQLIQTLTGHEDFFEVEVFISRPGAATQQTDACLPSGLSSDIASHHSW